MSNKSAFTVNLVAIEPIASGSATSKDWVVANRDNVIQFATPENYYMIHDSQLVDMSTEYAKLSITPDEKAAIRKRFGV